MGGRGLTCSSGSLQRRMGAQAQRGIRYQREAFCRYDGDNNDVGGKAEADLT